MGTLTYLFESEIVTTFNESINNNTSDMFGVIAIIFLIAWLVCLYLLYKFNSIGKPFYLFIFIFGIILSLLLGTHATDPIMYVIDGIGWANSGAILVLLYFSPIKKEFDK